MLDKIYIEIANALKNKKNNVPLSELEIDELDEIKLKYDNHYFSKLFHYALISNDQQVIELLIAKRQDLSYIKDSKSLSLLHNAVITGREKVVELLLERGVDVNVINNAAKTPLHYAVKKKSNQNIVQLLMQYKANPNAKDEYGKTPFNIAITHNYIDIVESLVSKADLSAEDEHGRTPLDIAIIHNHIDIVELLIPSGAKISSLSLYSAIERNYQDIVQLLIQILIQNGADLSAKDKHGRTLLDVAITYDYPDIVRLLINSGAKINNNTLLYAAKKGDKDMIESLIVRGASINVQDSEGMTPLHIAIEENNSDVTQFLLLNKANVNIQNSGGETPLHIAARQNNEEINEKITDLLIYYRADVNAQDVVGITPLDIAIKQDNEHIIQSLISNGANVSNKLDLLRKATDKGYIGIVELLIDKGIDLNAKDENNVGNTLLHVAAQNKHEGIARLLIENGADVNAQNNYGNLPLDYAISNGSAGTIKLLIDKKAKVNVSDNYLLFYAIAYDLKNVVEYLIDEVADVNTTYGRYGTLLHYAAKKGYTGIVKSLICRNANVNVPDIDGRTPLHYAAEKGNTNIAELLIRGGANVDVKDELGLTPLALASIHGHEDVVRLFIDAKASVNIQDEVLKTPLHYAVRKGHKNVARLLISECAHIDIQDIDGRTPLFLAIFSNNEDMVMLLIASRVDVNIHDNFFNTPLHYATYRNVDYSIIELLVIQDADVNVHNQYGRTPIDIAIDKNNTNVIDLLRNGIQKSVGDIMPIIKKINDCNNSGESISGSIYQIREHLNNYDPNFRLPLEDRLRLPFCSNDNAVLPSISDINNTSYTRGDATTVGLGLFSSLLLSKFMCSSNDQVISNQTANTTSKLFDSIYTDNIAEVVQLLNLGVDPNVKSESNQAPIHTAVLSNNPSIVEKLVQFKADINILNYEENTALDLAICQQNQDMVKTLLDLGAKVDIGNTPTIYTAALHKEKEIIKLLHDRGAGIDARNNKGRTALFLAVSSDSVEIANLLLRLGAKVNIHDHDGNYPIHLSVSHAQNIDMVELLCDHGADLDVQDGKGKTALSLAIAYDAKDKKDEENIQDIISFLLAQNACSNIPDNDGNFPIHSAIEQMRHSVIIEKLLIANKNNISYRNSADLTPLNLAVKCGNLDAVLILAKYTSVSDIGYAFALATENEVVNIAIERVLLQCMIDLDVKDGTKLISTGSVFLEESESKELLQPVSVKSFEFPTFKRKRSEHSSNTESSLFYSISTKFSSVGLESFKSCSSTSIGLHNRFTDSLDLDQFECDSVLPIEKRARLQ